MSDADEPPPPLPAPKRALPASQTLRRLFLTLYLRGRSSRGLNKDKAPKTVAAKLLTVLLVYGACGAIAFAFIGAPVFALSLAMHASTFVFLGMFVAGSAGEVLFNKEESEILMHRPISPRALLWAKVRVLVEVSLLVGLAFNLVALLVGMVARDGGWMYPVMHVASTALEALFCTACVVMVYQLCLRWFGRERLDALLTTSQVLFAVGAVLAGQLGPHLLSKLSKAPLLGGESWWAFLLPPAWFAGVDDALAGHGSMHAWALAGVGVTATAVLLWLAFGRLARSYQTGLQSLSETLPAVARPRRTRRSPLDWIISIPPFAWWLRDPVSRASFKLSIAYLLRDRDVKLRVYPGVAPLFVLPFVFLLRERTGAPSQATGFGIAFAGAYLGLAPYLGLMLLQYSQHWQASDVFRAAPLRGPALVSAGARRAALVCFMLPLLLIFGLLGWALAGDVRRVVLLLPGLIMVPLFALLACKRGRGLPLSLPAEDARAAGRGLYMIVASLISALVAGIGTAAWNQHWLGWFLAGETVAVTIAYFTLRRAVYRAPWPGFA